MLIPIGSWCRTAFQVNEFRKANGVSPASFPYDWTITSFAALERTLAANFDPSTILDIHDLEMNKVGSITDRRTQLIHHHDFSPLKLKRLAHPDAVDERGIPRSLYATDLIENAVARFTHTYRRMESLRESGNKVSFVRWQRSGHPDAQFPDVFKGESITSLFSVIRDFLAHENFSILTVKTHDADGQLPAETIIEYERSEHGVRSTIIERRGFNGDGTKNFKGDTVVWHGLLSRFIEDEGLALS